MVAGFLLLAEAEVLRTLEGELRPVNRAGVEILNRSRVTGLDWFASACSAFLPHWSVVETIMQEVKISLPDAVKKESMSSLERV